jgi:hypothetical protein
LGEIGRGSAGCGRGGGASSATPRRSSRTSKFVERTAEIHRRQMARAIGVEVEWRAEAPRHLDFLAQFGERLFWQQSR